MKTCPTCKADAAKERRGTLGELKGVWCTSCGRSTETIEAWENAWRGSDDPIVFKATEIPRSHLKSIAFSLGMLANTIYMYSNTELEQFIVQRMSSYRYKTVDAVDNTGHFSVSYVYELIEGKLVLVEQS